MRGHDCCARALLRAGEPSRCPWSLVRRGEGTRDWMQPTENWRGPGSRACYELSRGRRCERKSGQTRRRTKTLAIPRRGRQRCMSRFAPQPRAPGTRFSRAGMEAGGLGPIFLISASLVDRRHSVSVAPRSLNSEKLAPSAGHAKVNNRLWGLHEASLPHLGKRHLMPGARNDAMSKYRGRKEYSGS